MIIVVTLLIVCNTCHVLRQKYYYKLFIVVSNLLIKAVFYFLDSRWHGFRGETQPAINVFIIFSTFLRCVSCPSLKRFFFRAHEFPLQNWTVWVMSTFVKLHYSVRNWIIGFLDAMARPSVSPFVIGKGDDGENCMIEANFA